MPVPGKEKLLAIMQAGTDRLGSSSAEKDLGPWWGSELNVSQHCIVTEKTDNSNLGFPERSRATRLGEVVIPFT